MKRISNKTLPTIFNSMIVLMLCLSFATSYGAQKITPTRATRYIDLYLRRASPQTYESRIRATGGTKPLIEVNMPGVWEAFRAQFFAYYPPECQDCMTSTYLIRDESIVFVSNDIYSYAIVGDSEGPIMFLSVGTQDYAGSKIMVYPYKEVKNEYPPTPSRYYANLRLFPKGDVVEIHNNYNKVVGIIKYQNAIRSYEVNWFSQ